MAGEIFYPPPQPTQPTPHAPVPQQGDQPPRWSPRLLYSLVRAWDPPEPAPVQKPLTVAPLTLVYGDRPLASQRRKFTGYDAITFIWDTPVPFPEVHLNRPTTAPVPAQGQQPPRYSVQGLMALVRAWDPAAPAPQQLPEVVPIAGLPPVVNNPPRSSSTVLFSIIDQWKAPPPQPPQLPEVFPLSSAGAQPPKLSPVNLFRIIESWQPPFIASQRSATLAPWAAIAYGSQPPRYSVQGLMALIESWRPPPPQPPRPVPVWPIPTAPPGSNKVFINRVVGPGIDERLRRHTSDVSALLNSLIRKGYIVQVGPQEWELRLP